MKVTIGTIDEFERQALFSRRVVRQAADGILCSRRRGGEQHEEQQRGHPRQEIQFNGFLHNVCMLDYNLPAKLQRKTLISVTPLQ